MSSNVASRSKTNNKKQQEHNCNKNDTKWLARYAQLKEYWKMHGNCYVPKNYAPNVSLGSWTNKQRYQYRLYMQNNPSSAMTEHRISLLEEINFEWDANNIKKESDFEQWSKMFQKLKAYKEVHGDCNVPTKYPIDPSLSAWVRAQRVEHKIIHVHGKISKKLCSKKIILLERIGFNWDQYEARRKEIVVEDGNDQNSEKDVSSDNNENDKFHIISAQSIQSTNDSSKLRRDKQWFEHVEQLEEYKKKHRSCHIPRNSKEYPELGRWCSVQRQQYADFKAGRYSRLTKERIDILNDIGFVWEPKGGGQRQEKEWMKMFNDLKSYKSLHGNCNVSQKKDPYQYLGRWVCRQRRDYKTFKEGRPSAMTQQRFELLQELDFQWISTSQMLSNQMKTHVSTYLVTWLYD